MDGRVLVLALGVVLSGCMGAGKAPAHGQAAPGDASAPPPAVDASLASARPGLFDASPDGLQPLESLPGLTVTSDGEGTHYAYDVRESLHENTDVLLLVQALAPQKVRMSFDVDVPFKPITAGDRSGDDLVCIGTEMSYQEGEHGFYLDRALGHAGTPPDAGASGGFKGHSIGRGHAGLTSILVKLFGDRFHEAQKDEFDVPAGAFLRIDDGLSQYPPLATQGDDSHWWQNVTMTGPHRILRIPSTPLFCAYGFDQFEGVQVVGSPPFEVAQGGHQAIQTRYGSAVSLNLNDARGDPGPDPDPLNHAVVHFLDKTCQAGPEKAVVASSFDAGTIAVDVDRWAGEPVVILSGFARGQGLWAGDDEGLGDQCAS